MEELSGDVDTIEEALMIEDGNALEVCEEKDAEDAVSEEEAEKAEEGTEEAADDGGAIDSDTGGDSGCRKNSEEDGSNVSSPVPCTSELSPS